MDPGTAPRRSRHLVGISPSTSPPPLGERDRQSEQTSHHFDSHRYLTMSHHGSEVPKIPPSLPQVVEFEPLSTYGTPLDSGPYGTRPS